MPIDEVMDINLKLGAEVNEGMFRNFTRVLQYSFSMLTTSKFELPANDRRLMDSGDEVVKSSTIDEVDETKNL